jgi:shikimate kinase
MEVIFIYGPPAVGKATVANELIKLTGFRFFMNHQASDPVRAILDFEKDPTLFRKVCNEVKNLILGRAIDLNISGLIMSFCYSRPDSDINLAGQIDLFKKRGVKLNFVRLYCSNEELFKRVEDSSRKSSSTYKITEKAKLEESLQKHNFNEEISYVENFSIDNTNLSAKEVAKLIAEHYNFPILN